MNRALRAAALMVAAATTVGVAATSLDGTAAASGRHHAVQVRTYDIHMLARSNAARRSNDTPRYRMNHKLWLVAHKWAEHLAATGVLAHNPKLVDQVGGKCPAWTAIGENVGVTYGDHADQLFRAYMNSPEHRANILDPHYRQVGIATVKVVRNGQVQQWDVMDFGNHC